MHFPLLIFRWRSSAFESGKLKGVGAVLTGTDPAFLSLSPGALSACEYSGSRSVRPAELTALEM